ncbi:MAG: hypothetical protein KY476_25260, partial [Planctomycetes bacterium]|nr:hypothetical protein [Planctomycetota bacterium]
CAATSTEPASEGERPALEAHLWLYQRLLAWDEESAEEIVDEHLLEKSFAATADELLIPTLVLARRERNSDKIDDDDERHIVETLREVVDDLPVVSTELLTGGDTAAASPNGRRPLVVGFPLRETDEVILGLLGRLLDPQVCEVIVASTDMLIAERIALIEERRPVCVCVSSLPGDLVQTRRICKRLKQRDPELRIVVARWGGRHVSEKGRQGLEAAGAERIVSTLADLRETLRPLIQFRSYVGPMKEPLVANSV